VWFEGKHMPPRKGTGNHDCEVPEACPNVNDGPSGLYFRAPLVVHAIQEGFLQTPDVHPCAYPERQSVSHSHQSGLSVRLEQEHASYAERGMKACE
jgi:hypothetical protein